MLDYNVDKSLWERCGDVKDHSGQLSATKNKEAGLKDIYAQTVANLLIRNDYLKIKKNILVSWITAAPLVTSGLIVINFS